MTRDSALLVTAFFVMAALNYAFSVALSWLLPPEQFGQVGVAQSLLLLMALVVGSGFAWTTAYDVAAAGVTDKARRSFRAAWLANTALGLLLAGGLWIAYATGWLPLGPAYRAVVPLVGLTTVLLAARSVVNGAARGLYRFGLVAVNLVGEVAIKAAGGLALVGIGAGVAGVMAGFALGAAAALAHSLWIVGPARLWRGRDWFDGQVVTATIPLFMGVLGPALMLNLDVLGLKLLAPAGQGDELIGFYQAAVILTRTPIFVAQSLTLVLFSYVAGSTEDKETRRQGEGEKRRSHLVPLSPSLPVSLSPCLLYARAAVGVWAKVLLPAGLVLALAPQAALSLFFPAPYQATAPALRIAAGGGVLLALVTLLNGVAQAAGERRRPAVAGGLAVITQLVTLTWLVPGWGALGAALSLLTGGAVALIGIAPAFIPQPRSLALYLPRSSAPLLILVASLLLLPDGGRGAAAFKLGLTGLAYLIALIGLSLSGSALRRPRPGPGTRTGHPFARFLNVLLEVDHDTPTPNPSAN